MKPNNRMTYRFDHKGQALQGEETKKPVASNERNSEHAAASNVVSLYPDREQGDEREPQHDNRSWESSYQEDISALEQLIRDAKGTAAHTGDGENPIPSSLQPPVHPDLRFHYNFEKSGEDEFYNDDEDRFPGMAHDEAELLRGGRKGPSWLQVFFSVAGALATGAIFGYFILTLFTGASLWSVNSSQDDGGLTNAGIVDTADLGQGDSVQGNADAETNNNVPAIAETGENNPVQPSVTVGLEAKSYAYFMLQYGVFSNAAGRDMALSQLSAKGLPGAAFQTAQDYRVYAGIATDETKAAALESQMPGLEVYKKEVVVSTPTKFLYNGEASDVSAFIVGMNQLLGSWSSLISAQLQLSPLTPIGESAVDAWQNSYEAWKADYSVLKSGISDKSGKAALTRLGAAMDGAAAAMGKYNEKLSSAVLWDAQTSIMNAVLIQKEWFETMSAL